MLEECAYKTKKTKEQQIANDEKFRAVKALRVQKEKKQLIEDLEASKQALKNPDITIEDDLKYCDKM